MRTYTHMHTHNYRYTYALQLFKHLRQIQPADFEIDESIKARLHRRACRIPLKE